MIILTDELDHAGGFVDADTWAGVAPHRSAVVRAASTTTEGGTSRR